MPEICWQPRALSCPGPGQEEEEERLQFVLMRETGALSESPGKDGLQAAEDRKDRWMFCFGEERGIKSRKSSKGFRGMSPEENK